MDAHFDFLPKINGRKVGNVYVCQDHTNLHERLIFREQSQLNHIGNACLLEIGQMRCVVDMTLRIQIPVTNLDRMIKTETAHGAIIPLRMSLRAADGRGNLRLRVS